MKKILLALTFLSLLLAGCTPETSYQSVDKTPLSSFFSVQDQVNLVNELSKKLSNNPNIRGALGDTHPTLLIDIIKNKTDEHIDTESITDTLKTTIINDNLFRIVDRDKMNILEKEQKLNEMKLTESDKATALGKLWGVKYILYGNFSSIVNYVQKYKTTYYKLTLVLKNVETGQEIWVGEGSINKITK